MESIKPFYKILNELCEEKGIKQREISYGWIRELRKEDKAHYIMRYQFDLNSAIELKSSPKVFYRPHEL